MLFNIVDTTGRSKRRIDHFKICKNQKNVVLPCSERYWKLHCMYVSQTCVYWVKCWTNGDIFRSYYQLTRPGDVCTFVHNESRMECCEFRCWWWPLRWKRIDIVVIELEKKRLLWSNWHRSCRIKCSYNVVKMSSNANKD